MNARWKDAEVAGWGRSTRASMRLVRPERGGELVAALAEARAAGAGLVARGAGRSYGDAAQSHGGRGVLCERLDRILAFDAATNVVECEPGVTFRELLDTFVPRGLVPPTASGTSFATVGGGIAADIHGKNHARHGSFGDNVLWFDLLGADGTLRRVTPESDGALFRATIGGMGLTGIVARAAFRLIPGAAQVRVRERRIADLDAFFAAFAEFRDTATFTVGWIDALARGRSLGRGVFETAEFAPEAGPALSAATPRRVGFDFPSFALSSPVVRAFNELYWRRVPASGREGLRLLDRFLYPLDGLADWHRLYGKRGFYQFQSVVPDATAAAATRAMLETVSAGGNASPLAVLKTLGGDGRGDLSFPTRGATLALDIPRAAGAEELLYRLECIARDAGGRIYLAKDAVMHPETLRATYPRLPAFEATLARVDPDGVFESDLARRLGIGRGGR